MMSDTPYRAMTVEEACAAYGEDGRWELIEGEVVTMTPAGFDHSRVGVRLFKLLLRWQDSLPEDRRESVEFGSFEAGWQLGREGKSLLAPDLTITNAESKKELHHAGSPWNHGAPDYAVEIISPSDRVSLIQRKVSLYLEAGTREVWIIDPGQQRMIVHTADNIRSREYAPGDTYEGTGILEGFHLPAAELFRAP